MSRSFLGFEAIDVDATVTLIAKRGGKTDGLATTLNEVNRAAKSLNLNARLITAVVAHETDAMKSSRYTDWGNPGGIAISHDAATEVWRPYRPRPIEIGSMIVAAIAQKILERSVAIEVPLAYKVPGMSEWLVRSLGFTKGSKYPSPIRTTDDMVKQFTDDSGETQYVWAEDQNWPKGVEGWYAILPTGGTDTKGSGAAETVYTFGNVTHPPYQDRLVTDEQSGAWDDLGKRSPYGVVQHSMIGSLVGTDSWFRRGIGVSDGLTDYGVGNSTDGPSLDGVIFRWNDPLGIAHPGVSPNRAGWANGGSDGLEGDGPAFVQKLGVNAINRNMVSIERSDGGEYATQGMSEKQFESLAKLTARWFDYDRVPWDLYPFNPHVACVTHMLHKEFATKDCPFPPVYNRIDELQNRIRAILKAGQTASTDPSVPPVVTPPKQPAWPHKWTTKDLAARFGSLTRVFVDGTTKQQHFSAKGAISNAWVGRGNTEGMKIIGQLPKPAGWYELPVDKASGLKPEIIIFDMPGLKNWTLYRPSAGIAWRWIA